MTKRTVDGESTDWHRSDKGAYSDKKVTIAFDPAAKSGRSFLKVIRLLAETIFGSGQEEVRFAK